MVSGFSEIKKTHKYENTLSNHDSIHGHRNLNETKRSAIARYRNFHALKICKITVVSVTHAPVEFRSKAGFSSSALSTQRVLLTISLLGFLRTFDFYFHAPSTSTPLSIVFLTFSPSYLVPNLSKLRKAIVEQDFSACLIIDFLRVQNRKKFSRVIAPSHWYNEWCVRHGVYACMRVSVWLTDHDCAHHVCWTVYIPIACVCEMFVWLLVHVSSNSYDGCVRCSFQ